MIKDETRAILGTVSRIRELSTLRIQHELDARGYPDIVPAHGRVLIALYRQSGPLTMTELVEASGRVKSTISSLVKSLSKNGYVERFVSEEDRRVNFVRLTEKGERFQTTFKDITESVMTTVYSDMPADQRIELVRLLRFVECNLDSAKIA